ncbi:MAG TPA: SGNH/GDSL hydrolase family protein [Nocardioidaceae bacterium]|nr:SGNH/GDSL hydrolase family protein [Nocardioidaceae bacterium]
MNRVMRSALSVLLGIALLGAVLSVSDEPDEADTVATTGKTTTTLPKGYEARQRPTQPTSRPRTTAKRTPAVAAPLDRKQRQVRSTSTDEAVRGYAEYVALGDSWSADVVIADANGLPDDTHAPIDCAQSRTNYPKLVAQALGITNFRDATCGSATTEHFANPQAGLPLGGTNPPQFDRLTRTTDLVTVGIGGNDAGIAGAAVSCLSLTPMSVPLGLPLPDLGIPFVSLTELPTGGCKERFTAGGVDVLAQAIARSRPKLVAAFKRIHELSPKARILAVNYLAGLPEQGCWPLVPFTDSDIQYLHATFLKLNAMVARAAAKARVELVDAFTPSLGHDVCAGPTERYVEAIGVLSLNGLAIAVPAHPNSAGAAAQARAVLATLR